MANLPESSQWDNVYQLETTDPAEAGESGILNTPFKNLVNRTKWLKDEKLARLSGASTFNGTTGQSIAHNMGATAYNVAVVATADPNGDLGEVWVSKGTTSFTVYNTGGFRGAFDWVLVDEAPVAAA